ncbi:Protein of unknown function, partial [Cotesia congregata]
RTVKPKLILHSLTDDKKTIIRQALFADGSEKIIKELLNVPDGKKDSSTSCKIIFEASQYSNTKKGGKKKRATALKGPQEDKLKDDDIEILLLDCY